VLLLSLLFFKKLKEVFILKIVVINCGSSSLKFSLFDMNSESVLFSGHIDGIGLERCIIKTKKNGVSDEKKILVSDHVDAVLMALKSIKSSGTITDYSDISAIGHRVVHGGEYYSNPVLINEAVIKRIKELISLAPLHNPANLAGIMACKKMLPKIPQVAIFDTAFHQTMTPENYLYSIPMEFYSKHKIRRYGFHGTSHKYVSEQAIKILGKKDSKIITCHLGNGCSVTAIKNGKSVVTSMGLTPLEGLMMGTRSGSIDPGIISFLSEKGFSSKEIDNVLNKKSGLLGISGITSDVRDLYKHKLEGNKEAKLALDMFASKVAFYIGGYSAILNGVDCIVFTGGIGEGGVFMRKQIVGFLDFLGVKLDSKANRNSDIIISAQDSKVKLYVIPTKEELEIARETKIILKK
jgi:acetate kinase